MSQVILLLALLFFAETPSAQISPGQTLECVGFGQKVPNTPLVKVTEAKITPAELQAGQRLAVNYFDIVEFRVSYEDGKYVAQFSEEDEGLRENQKFSTRQFKKLNGLRTQLPYNITDVATRQSFWKLVVLCTIRGN